MAQNQRFFRYTYKESSLLAKYIKLFIALFTIALIGTVAHFLKNYLLGQPISHEKHLVVTTQVNFCLLIGSVIFIRHYLKEFAFTLVELSIVLIIIGFIIAGITAGISMAKAARLNAVVTEIRNMQVAILNFRSRYNSLPGDHPGAFAIWGSACGDGTIGGANSCSGNGNGFVDFANPSTNPPAENIKFWQHLSLAQMLSSNLTGQIVPTTGQVAGVNVPRTAYGNGGGYWALNVSYSIKPLSNFIELGTYYNVGGNGRAYQASIMSPIDAYGIDSKMDDGNPIAGLVTVLRGTEIGSTLCVTGNAVAPSSYIFTDTSNSCRLDFYVIDAQ